MITNEFRLIGIVTSNFREVETFLSGESEETSARKYELRIESDLNAISPGMYTANVVEFSEEYANRGIDFNDNIIGSLALISGFITQDERTKKAHLNGVELQIITKAELPNIDWNSITAFKKAVE